MPGEVEKAKDGLAEAHDALLEPNHSQTKRRPSTAYERLTITSTKGMTLENPDGTVIKF